MTVGSFIMLIFFISLIYGTHYGIASIESLETLSDGKI